MDWLAALIAVPFLLLAVIERGDAQSIVGISVFSLTIVLLFLASTLYHAFPEGRAKHIFEILDNSAIYLLIAGTYTPFTLGLLRAAGAGRFRSDLGPCPCRGASHGHWSVAVPVLSACLCLTMGWLVVVLLRPLAGRMPGTGLWLILGGGPCLYAWNHLLRRATASLPSFDLASVCLDRNRPSFRRNLSLHDLSARLSFHKLADPSRLFLDEVNIKERFSGDPLEPDESFGINQKGAVKWHVSRSRRKPDRRGIGSSLGSAKIGIGKFTPTLLAFRAFELSRSSVLIATTSVLSFLSASKSLPNS